MNNQLFYMFMYFKVLCRFVFKNNIPKSKKEKICIMHVISGSCHSEQKRFPPRHVASDVIDRTLGFFSLNCCKNCLVIINIRQDNSIFCFTLFE